MFKKIITFATGLAVDRHYNNVEKKVSRETYAQVGKKINRAKKYGVKVDGFALYENTLNRNMRKARQRKNRIDNFLN